jgi:YggT family protein
VTSLLAVLDIALWVLRRVVIVVVVIAALIALVDWLVRTRRVSPFSGVARFFRNSVSPLMTPIERRVVSAGGLPANAPWWTLAAVTIAGIVLLSFLGFLRGQVVGIAVASSGGPGAIVRLVVGWIFAILQIAILVRVFSSLFRVSPYSPWVRWSYRLSEPILAPLRRVIPPIGMIDLSPLVAYFLLSLVEMVVMSALR